MLIWFMLLLGRVSFSDQHFLQYALPSCSVRYETRHYHNYTCEQIYAAQPICKRKLRIAYSHFPPYIFQDANKNVKGFIPGILLLKMIYSLKEWRLLKFVKNSVKSLQNLINSTGLDFHQILSLHCKGPNSKGFIFGRTYTYNPDQAPLGLI